MYAQTVDTRLSLLPTHGKLILSLGTQYVPITIAMECTACGTNIQMCALILFHCVQWTLLTSRELGAQCSKHASVLSNKFEPQAGSIHELCMLKG